MNKSLEYIERELEWLRKGGSRELDQEAEIKNLEQVKNNLERLEKLENIIDILKDEAYITIETDIDETGTEFHATLREKGGNGEIFIDEVTRGECYLLEEVLGE